MMTSKDKSQRYCSFTLLPWITLGEASCYAVRTLTESYAEGFLPSTGGFLPTTRHVDVPSWK